MDTSDYTFISIIQKAIAGDQDAFCSLLKLTEDQIQWVAKKYLSGDLRQSEDIYQETCVTLWEDRKVLKGFEGAYKEDPIKKFRSYFVGIMKNVAHRLYRKKCKRSKKQIPSTKKDISGSKTSKEILIEREVPFTKKDEDGNYVEIKIEDPRTPSPEDILIEQENKQDREIINLLGQKGVNCACKSISKRDKSIFREYKLGRKKTSSKEICKKHIITEGHLNKIIHDVRKKLILYVQGLPEWESEYNDYMKKLLVSVKKPIIYYEHLSSVERHAFLTNEVTMDDIKKFIWHIRECQKCRERLKTDILTDAIKNIVLWDPKIERTKNCPVDSFLRNYILNESKEISKEQQMHIDNCPYCQGFLLFNKHIMFDIPDPGPEYDWTMPEKKRKVIKAWLDEYRVLGVQKIIDWELKVKDGQIISVHERISLIPMAGQHIPHLHMDFPTIRKFYIWYFLAKVGLTIKNQKKIIGFFQTKLNFDRRTRSEFFYSYLFPKPIYISIEVMNKNHKELLITKRILIEKEWSLPISFEFDVGDSIGIFIEYGNEKSLLRIKTHN